MSTLLARFGIFGEKYDGRQMRALISELERVLSQVEIDGTAPRSTVASGTTYAVTATDKFILCDTTTADITIQLPLPENTLVLTKHEVNVKKEAAANVLYITPTGVAVTDYGTSTIVVNNKGTSLCFRATEDGWRIV